ncbi:hypothetical protein B7R54_00175 [Subtercola boreus]|uniref:HTH lacI-type domain-containing protein n=1 Tax=Subtercola boreus TaxID=120213 RepID=A0A3E0VDR8_9MICO|nr:LacI family DNA-binding transcriptional regulator [Subtercola boreus]RFA07799.1 hypothetical protein B7R54_00175 [Subtercola boreus]TQL55354.1 LacI family transcriptional regulator [Subtercola boreus]
MNSRITQKDIARLAGVSQTIVSFVLNERDENLARVPEATRARVLRIIRETGYVADPIARRLKQMGNRMIGVYTYEALFPLDREDFFYPFLAGIEEEAQRLDHDLLLLTSGRAGGRNLGLSAGATRLRLADCCILLGQYMPSEELQFLVGSGFPFVSIGRRDDAGGPLPYVAADYEHAVGELVDRARSLGHERFVYLGYGSGVESYVDRAKGFDAQAGRAGIHLPPVGDSHEWIRVIREAGATVVFVEQHEQVEQLTAALASEGLAVPSAFSLVSLSGSPDAPDGLTGFELPRREMGRIAVSMLSEPGKHEAQVLLGCTPVAGRTLVAAPR